MPNYSIDYDVLKDLAKRRGVAVADLIPLSASNDPFYSGTPGDVAAAEWFAALWHQFGFGSGVHIRRMHYQIVSQDPPIEMPNGDAYENTERCWDVLNNAAKHARYQHLIDAERFVDRRNPPPQEFMFRREEAPYITTRDELPDDFAALPGFPDLPTYGVGSFNGEQRYLVEIWAEKSTMNDVLVPFCRERGLNLVTGLGELSITAVVGAIRRIKRMGKPARILYISDFDPAGAGMPISVARKIEYFIRRETEGPLADRRRHQISVVDWDEDDEDRGEDDYDDYDDEDRGEDDEKEELPNGGAYDVRLQPVVLNLDQIRQYRLPRTPIKESEKRAAAFEARFGAGAVELDALEALRPGELVRILQRAVDPYYDRSLEGRVRQEFARLSADLLALREAVLRRHYDRIKVVRTNYEAAKAEAEALLAGPLAAMRELWEQVDAELDAEKADIADYPLPEGREATESDGMLYDSQRAYFEQLRYYKRQQGKPFNLGADRQGRQGA